MNKELSQKYFFLLFSVIPLSIILGPSISLINIVLISLSFLAYCFYKKEYKFLKNKVVVLLLFVYLYLIFNSLIALDFEISLKRNFGFIRFILFFVAINYFIFKNENFIRIIFYWFLIIFIFLIDVYFEIITGKNTLGFGGPQFAGRLVGFFKTEPIVGSFLNGFYLLIIGYLFSNLNNNLKQPSNIYYNKFSVFIFLIIIILAIFFSGERANFIRSFICLIIFLSLYQGLKLKYKFLFSLVFIALLSIVFLKSEYLKHRYITQFASVISNPDKFVNIKSFKLYSDIYRSGLLVFKNYPIFGVGNKNYRIETCDEQAKEIIYICITHPHQIYIEFLSEHGLFGSTILLSILFYLIFRLLKPILQSRNYLQLGCIIYLIQTFLPILPSGAFFHDFNLTIFCINFSLMYAVNKQTNIFYQKF